VVSPAAPEYNKKNGGGDSVEEKTSSGSRLLRACTHTHTHTRCCAHAHTHTHTHARAHTHTHVHTHIHIHTRTRTHTGINRHQREIEVCVITEMKISLYLLASRYACISCVCVITEIFTEISVITHTHEIRAYQDAIRTYQDAIRAYQDASRYKLIFVM